MLDDLLKRFLGVDFLIYLENGPLLCMAGVLVPQGNWFQYLQKIIVANFTVKGNNIQHKLQDILHVPEAPNLL